jgi:glycosyltransferase involved in cell wall biosynthesis
MSKVSVSIIVLNDAENLKAAAASVAWADELVVIDTGSTDDTLAVAQSLGARIVNTQFNSFSEVRNLAADSCSHEWIFSLDPDERCTPQVRDEILAIVNLPDAGLAYLVPRRNFILGRWMKAKTWYPNFRDPQLFRKGAFQREGIVDETITLADDKIGRLRHAIWHMPYGDLGEIIFKMNRYSSMRERQMAQKPVSMATALGHGLATFFRLYVMKQGFRDGWPGFIIAFSNFETTFYKYAKRGERIRGWDQPPAETAGLAAPDAPKA